MKRVLVLMILLLAAAVALGIIRGYGAKGGPAKLPEIVSFTAVPRVIGDGESAELKWETRGTTSVAVQWGPEDHPRGAMQRHGGLPPTGSMTVQPKENTIYVLECETQEGQVCTSASTAVRLKRLTH